MTGFYFFWNHSLYSLDHQQIDLGYYIIISKKVVSLKIKNKAGLGICTKANMHQIDIELLSKMNGNALAVIIYVICL